MASPSASLISVAILDDYLSLSTPHFSQIPPSKAHITTFTDSFPQYPHPSTASAQRDAIAARLKPFTVLCTMRERTPFPKELFQRLPNLKLLLCTGTQFNTFDIKAAKEKGITIATVHGRGRSDRPKTQPLSEADITKGSAHPTTQHTWAMILALARNVSTDDRAMMQGGWQTSCAMGLTGKVLGIVGVLLLRE
jgi:lactate dehydrogenase-like 2-hydroxyacid dehydrogenase